MQIMGQRVSLEVKGNRIIIACPYIPKLVAELKELEGYKYEGSYGGSQPFHSCKNTSRNKFTLDVLSSGQFTGESLRYARNTICAQSTRSFQRQLWKHQQDAFRFKVEKLRCIDAGEMGCISGDAIIHCNRAKRGFEISLKDLYLKFTGKKGRWNYNPIYTYIRSLCGEELRLNKIKKVLDKGLKTCYKLKLKSGKFIDLTYDHEVCQTIDKYTSVENLRAGDQILTNGKWVDKDGYVRDFLPVVDYVVSIEPIGTKEVYDIVCEEPHRNFVANSIIVHNCGKTLSTIEALEFLRMNPSAGVGWPGAIWWVGPNSALTAFRTQCRKWSFSLKYGDKVFNYHNLERVMQEAIDPPQMIVFDESSCLKNATARRTQLAIALVNEMEKKYASNCAVFLLTGTPAPQNPFDWWSQCEVARPGWLRESTISHFQRRLAEYEPGERADGGYYPKFVQWQQRELDLLPKRLEGLVLVTWKKDCLDLPEKVYEEVVCPPDTATLRVARALAKGSGGESALQVQSKLRQLSDGFQYIKVPCPECQRQDQENAPEGILRQESEGINVQSPPVCHRCNGRGFTPETRMGTTPKDGALVDILEEHQEVHRIVIYAAFTASVDRVVSICQKEGWHVWRYDGRGQQVFGGGRGISVDETVFQDNVKNSQNIAFVGNPEAAGMGLTLTPSPTVVFYSNSFKSQFRVQAEDRIHRPGASKERGCKIIDLIHLPSDRLVLERLKEKRDVETTTLEDINSYLNEAGV